MKNSVTRDAFLAIAAAVAALAPFLNKAFHIDDPLFLWMAQQISQHPADPYGFSVNWYVSAKPMFSIMQNPHKCILHGSGRELPWLERAGDALRFPHSSDRGCPRNIFSGAAPFRFAFACRAAHAFHARFPHLGDDSYV